MTTTTDGRRDSLADQLQAGRAEVRGIGAEIGEIAVDLRVLAEKEAQLAKAEMTEQLSLSARSLGWAVAAFLFAWLTAVFLFVTVMFALDLLLPLWAAALVTTVLLAALAAAAAGMAYQRFSNISLVPRRTLNSLGEDLAWARQQLKSSVR